MGCSGRVCTAEKIFIFINIAFAMYSGALLATGARLAWDPSTYAWFRFMCEAQYRVSAAYVAAAGAWLAALVYLAAAAAASAATPAAPSRPHAHCLHLYCAGVVCLALSEVCYGAWLGWSLAAWWRDSPRAELARRGLDLLHDIKPALLAMERYRDVARPLYDMIEEVEHEAPNNVFVIIIFGIIGLILQVAAVVMARRLARRGAGARRGGKAGGPCACDEDSDSADADADADAGAGEDAGDPGWRKKANLRMYTILDKIF